MVEVAVYNQIVARESEPGIRTDLYRDIVSRIARCGHELINGITRAQN
jgi:hypothetical protein